MITVILADDHPVVRDGLHFLLNSQKDIKVIGTAENGHEAVELAAKLNPDVVVMDIAMPLLNGIEATQQIRAECPLSRKIAETVVEDYVRQGGSDVLEGLSPRERQVLQLIAEGKTSAEAAKLLFLSVKTVETYRSRFMQKLGLKDMTALVKFAIQHGIISLEQ